MSNDLTTPQSVFDYLTNLSESSDNPRLARLRPRPGGLDELSGGNSNYVWRVWLDVPMDISDREGMNSSLSWGEKGTVKTVVLKHTKPFVRGWKELGWSTQRQVYEVEAMRRVEAWQRRLFDHRPPVTVPHIYHYDQEACVIIMEDAGPESQTLKSFLTANQHHSLPIDESLFCEIGRETGRFLRLLHAWGRGGSKDSESKGEEEDKEKEALVEVIRGNLEARKMSAWYFYGQFEDALRDSVRLGSGETQAGRIRGFEKYLRRGDLKLSPEEIEKIRDMGRETQETLVNSNDNFVQGDFWPGNMLVRLQPDSAKGLTLDRILVVDWEMSKTGIASIELGQFVAEMRLVQLCLPQSEKTASLVLKHYLQEYGYEGLSEEGKERMMRHVGAHIILLAERWGGEGAANMDPPTLVREAVEILLDRDGGVSRNLVLGV